MWQCVLTSIIHTNTEYVTFNSDNDFVPGGVYVGSLPRLLDYRDSRPRAPRTRRDSGMTASFQYSSAVCINPIAMRS